MSTVKWGTIESLQSLLTTELNSLANSTSEITGKILSAEIDNEAGLYPYITFELVADFGGNPAAGGYVGLWILKEIDGTNFEDGSTTVDPARTEDVYIPLRTNLSTVQRVTIVNIVIPPYGFKVLLRNKSGQAMDASGNTLKYRRHY